MFRRSGRRRDRRDPPTRCRPPSARQTPPCRLDRTPHTQSGRGGCSLLLTLELLFEGERGISHSSETSFTATPSGRGSRPSRPAGPCPRSSWRRSPTRHRSALLAEQPFAATALRPGNGRLRVVCRATPSLPLRFWRGNGGHARSFLITCVCN